MKKIGIVGWKTGDNSFGVTVPYIDWLSNFGTVHILSPQKGSVVDLYLLVILLLNLLVKFQDFTHLIQML